MDNKVFKKELTLSLRHLKFQMGIHMGTDMWIEAARQSESQDIRLQK